MLGVSLSGGEYLADVGFGSATLTAPLRLRADIEQQTPHETFRLVGGDPEWRLDIRIGEEWRPVYAFETIERTFEELSALNDLASSDPTFRDNLIAARSAPGERHTLHNLVLKHHHIGAGTETVHLRDAAEIREVLTGVFGLSLPADRLDVELQRIIDRELPQLSSGAA